MTDQGWSNWWCERQRYGVVVVAAAAAAVAVVIVVVVAAVVVVVVVAAGGGEETPVAEEGRSVVEGVRGAAREGVEKK